MDQGAPFVVVVAGGMGRVGKTTIATNLAVYLKALREDLPVTVVSFDTRFSADRMFAIGDTLGASVAGLFAGIAAGELVTLGEYGVQYLATDRDLVPPDDNPAHLRAALARSDLPGILILDTQPTLDYFTRSALLAADLLLVPVKDRPSLAHAAALRRALAAEGGDPNVMWLLPSLLDDTMRLRDDVGLKDFLVFSARERGYQVLETVIAQNPEVESLATDASCRGYPVLTHARTTPVHGQFRDLGNFVLERFDTTERPRCLEPDLSGTRTKIPPGRMRHLRAECPLCGKTSRGEEGAFFQDLRSRRQGFVHSGCCQSFLETGLPVLPPASLLAFQVAGPGFAGGVTEVAVSPFDSGGERLSDAHQVDPAGPSVAAFLQGATGRREEELYRELLILVLEDGPPALFLTGEGHARLSALRRRVMRDVLGSF